MLLNNSILICIFLISSSATFLSIPHVKRLGKFLNIIEQPKDRGQNKVPMIRSGGLAMIISYVFVILFLLFIRNFINIEYLNFLIKISFMSIAFFLVGLVDDFLQLSPWIKLISQIILASIISAMGMYSNTLILPDFLGQYILYIPSSLAILINIFFIVSLINAINWLDGLDGLASGYSGIVSLGFLILSIFTNNTVVAVLAVINIGICLGFLRYNFYPAHIFMGDCGSYFLGANLSLMSINLFSFDTSLVNFTSISMLLFYPLFDMVRVILKRLIDNKSPFFPDREHFHHILIDKGLSDKKAVLIIYIMTVLFVLLSISFLNYWYFLCIFPFLILINLELT